MNDEKEKYANGVPLDASKMSKEEKLKAIEQLKAILTDKRAQKYTDSAEIYFGNRENGTMAYR